MFNGVFFLFAYFVFLYDVLWSSCHRMIRLLKDCYRWSHGWKEIRTLGEVTGSLQWQFQTRKEVRWPTGDSWPLSMLCTDVREVSPYEYGLILTVWILSWDGFQMNVIHLTSPHLPTQDFQVTAWSVWRSRAQPWLICCQSLQGQDQGRAMKLPLLLWLALRQITSQHSNAAFSFRVADIFKIKLAKGRAGS